MQNFVFSKIMILLSCVIASRALALDAEVLQLVEEALRANPTLEAKRAQIEAITQLADAAGSWNDPMLSIEYMNAPTDSLRIDRSPMSGVQLKLEQNFPELGWSKASRELAALEVAASAYQAAEAELALRQSVETLYWQLALSRGLREVTARHLQRTEDLLQSVNSRYETGVVGQSSVSRLLVLRERLRDDLQDFDQSEAELRAGLLRVLARSAQEEFVVSAPSEPLPTEEAFGVWLSRAVAEHPVLAQIREEIKVEQKALELARIQARPDLNLWIAYQVREYDDAMDDGTDFVSAGISIPIPLGSRKRELAQAAARRAGERGAKARLAEQTNSIREELQRSEARWTRAHQKALTYRDTLLPSAQLALQATLADFAVDRADFTALYESQVELLELEKAYLVTVTETYLQRANVRGLAGLGGDVPAVTASDVLFERNAGATPDDANSSRLVFRDELRPGGKP